MHSISSWQIGLRPRRYNYVKARGSAAARAAIKLEKRASAREARVNVPTYSEAIIYGSCRFMRISRLLRSFVVIDESGVL